MQEYVVHHKTDNGCYSDAVICIPAINLLMFLTLGRLRRQQDQSGQTSSTESRASLQSHGKLQDGRNNNLLGHGCTRGCSS